MTQSEELYEFNGPTDDGTISGTPVGGSTSVKASNRTGSARAYSSASQITAGLIVKRSTHDTQKIEKGSNACLAPFGVAVDDQLDNGDGTYDTTRPITFVTGGLVRVTTGAAIDADVYYCSDANGKARTWVTGVDDTQSIVGITRSKATAADETIYATVSGE